MLEVFLCHGLNSFVVHGITVFPKLLPRSSTKTRLTACALMQALEQLSIAQASLAAIAELSTGTVETLANVQESFNTTFLALKTAITSEIVGFDEAIALWKVARRRTLVCI